MSMMVGRARASSMGDPGLFDWGRKALGYAAKTALGMTGFGGAAGAISAAVGPRTPRSVNGYVPSGNGPQAWRRGQSSEVHPRGILGHYRCSGVLGVGF